MTFLSKTIRKQTYLITLALMSALLAGCHSEGPAPANNSAAAREMRIDPLHAGDSIRIDFSGTPAPVPTVQTEIKGDGTVHLDFIGDVMAEGKTPGELERCIQTNYVPAYYTHLSVTVTPVARYFYVEGEINGVGGGRILYAGPITVTRAIAAAGDFNPFADRKRVRLYRMGATKAVIINCIKALDDPRLDLPVYPGDKVVVKRRFY